MIFHEAEQYLYSLVAVPRREYMRDTQQCDIYLKRLQFFLNILGNPEKKIPKYIHVTGTSGKGSVCRMLESILIADGKKVGVETSPHPTKITERWTVGGHPISDELFINLVQEIKQAVAQYIETSPYDLPSFFELTTALGLLAFAHAQVEWVILEVGCGGRYDATNIIPHKEAAIITNIGLDHTDILGHTKEAIAREKSGIIRQTTKVFTAESDALIFAQLQQAAHEARATITHVTAHDLTAIDLSTKGTVFEYAGTTYHTPGIGTHQAMNAGLAIACASALNIQTVAIKKGLAAAPFITRFEVIQQTPLFILDSAHNEDKMHATVQTWKHIAPLNRPTLILGFSEGKKWQRMVQELLSINPLAVICTEQTTHIYKKNVSADELCRFVRTIAPQTISLVERDHIQALRAATRHLSPSHGILITGSCYLSGQLRPIIFGSVEHNLTAEATSFTL